MAEVELGQLERVDPRQLWPFEARDFTPWLAANLSHLGAALGLDIELEKIEAAVGSFSCDIKAKDTGSGRVLIVENQLNETDHGHLGQLITYAAGLDAGVIVWIAASVREEHREAIDFLNRVSKESVDFFLIALEVIRISGSLPAVVFRLAASPNAWAKNIAGSSTKSATEKTAAYQKFYQGLMDELREKHQFTNAKAAQPQSWYSFSTGVSGISYSTTFANGSKLRAEVYIDTGDLDTNKAAFDFLRMQASTIEAELGEPVAWERLDTRRASRISLIRENTTIMDAQQNDLLIREWLVVRLLKLKKVFGPRLRSALAAQAQADMVDC